MTDVLEVKSFSLLVDFENEEVGEPVEEGVTGSASIASTGDGRSLDEAHQREGRREGGRQLSSTFCQLGSSLSSSNDQTIAAWPSITPSTSSHILLKTFFRPLREQNDSTSCTHLCLMIPWKGAISLPTYSKIPTSVSIGGLVASMLPSRGRFPRKRKVEGGRSDLSFVSTTSSESLTFLDSGATTGASFIADSSGSGERERARLEEEEEGAVVESIFGEM